MRTALVVSLICLIVAYVIGKTGVVPDTLRDAFETAEVVLIIIPILIFLRLMGMGW